MDPSTVVNISVTSPEDQSTIGLLPQIYHVPGYVIVLVRGHQGFKHV